MSKTSAFGGVFRYFLKFATDLMYTKFLFCHRDERTLKKILRAYND